MYVTQIAQHEALKLIREASYVLRKGSYSTVWFAGQIRTISQIRTMKK